MKKFLTILLVSLSISAISQTTINPDTVCVNATGEQYYVAVTPTSTYQWTITGGGGILQTGQTTSSITVDWGGVSGNTIGPFCPGDPTTPLVGSPAGGTWSGTGVVGNNFQPSTGVGNYVLTYSMAGCNTTINVTVNNGPITGPIQHF